MFALNKDLCELIAHNLTYDDTLRLERIAPRLSSYRRATRIIHSHLHTHYSNVCLRHSYEPGHCHRHNIYDLPSNTNVRNWMQWHYQNVSFRKHDLPDYFHKYTSDFGYNYTQFRYCHEAFRRTYSLPFVVREDWIHIARNGILSTVYSDGNV